MKKIYFGNELHHYGIKGQKWGVRRFQNEDGTLTPEGKERYSNSDTVYEAERMYLKTQARKQAKTTNGKKYISRKRWTPLTDAEKSVKNSRNSANDYMRSSGTMDLYGQIGCGELRDANMSDISNRELEEALFFLLGINLDGDEILFDDGKKFFELTNQYTGKNHEPLSIGIAKFVITKRYLAVQDKVKEVLHEMKRNDIPYGVEDTKRIYKKIAEEMYPRK